MLVWREIAIQNNKMTSFGLLKFLVDADVIPRLLGPENLNEIVQKITVSVYFMLTLLKSLSHLSRLKSIISSITALSHKSLTKTFPRLMKYHMKEILIYISTNSSLFSPESLLKQLVKDKIKKVNFFLFSQMT